MQEVNKNKFKVDQLLYVYLLTMFGSSMTTVTSFISVEGALKSVNYLAVALALRTAGFFVFNYFSPYIFHRFGEKKTIIGAQGFGLFALILLGIGFANGSALLVCAGIILTGIPGNLLVTGTLVTLKKMIDEPTQFRKASARRELYSGITLMTAGILAPILVPKVGIEKILFFDAISYLLAVVLLARIRFSTSRSSAESHRFPNPTILQQVPVRHFFFAASGALILMAALPVISSSQSVREFLGLHSASFGTLWAVEGFIGICAATIYSKLGSNHLPRIISAIVHINALLLISIFFPMPDIAKLLTICLLPLAFSISFFSDRDNLLIEAGNDSSEINLYAAFSGMTRAFWGSVSPFVFTIPLGLMSPEVWLGLILTFQIIVYLNSLRGRIPRG